MFMRRSLFIAIAGVAAVLAACKGGKSDAGESFPANFNGLPDTARVAYVMKNTTPDSVARFICRAALGQVKGAGIESLGVATSYAYEKYSGNDLDSFGDEYDNFVSSLPLADKMRMYVMAGVEDPQGLGLQLGLEYMQSVRENNLSVDDVKRELKAFKQACGNDSNTYKRFIIGFRTVLEADSGRDMPKAIYDNFINYE